MHMDFCQLYIKLCRKKDEKISIEKTIKKLICQAPIGLSKSTALRKWIFNSVPNNKLILIVPTINIAMELNSKLLVALYNNHPKNTINFNFLKKNLYSKSSHQNIKYH